jgi:chemosensory pili system protein ChpB (putative protein-glutamate methylesterase)
MHFGFKVILTTDSSKMKDKSGLTVEVDAWVVDIADEETEHLWLNNLFDGDVPVLFGMCEAPERSSEHYPRWEKRLFAKMKELLTNHSLTIANENTINALKYDGTENFPFLLLRMFQNIEIGLPEEHIWLLGASLGGPDAIKEFLDALPKGLPVGFVYAQHIDALFQQALIQTLGRHSGITMVPHTEGSKINSGEIMLALVEHEFSFDYEGRLISKNTI